LRKEGKTQNRAGTHQQKSITLSKKNWKKKYRKSYFVREREEGGEGPKKLEKSRLRSKEREMKLLGRRRRGRSEKAGRRECEGDRK